MKNILISMLVFVTCTSISQAAKQNTSSGKVESVRTYQVGGNGLRAQITLSGATHECGTNPTILYFDTGMVPTDVVKTVTSLAFGAMIAGKPVVITYDCAFGSGGHGWGYALSVNN